MALSSNTRVELDLVLKQVLGDNKRDNYELRVQKACIMIFTGLVTATPYTTSILQKNMLSILEVGYVLR